MSRFTRLPAGVRGFLVAIITLVSAALPLGQVAAATSVGGTGNGLKISPVVSNVTINPGGSKTLDVYITNVTGATATFQVAINDFTAGSQEDGTPALILDNNKAAPTHSLRQFVPNISDVTLAAGEQKDVKVPITVPATAPAGGYFGAVRFVATNNATGNQNAQVALSASVASLVLVKVPGNYKEQMGIASFDVRSSGDRVHTVFTKNKNLASVVRFNNTGDIQEVPFGKVTVTNFRGKTVFSTEVNDSDTPGNVLPNSIRKFSTPLKSGIGGFGKYTVRGDFGYGKGQTLTATTTFYVIPMPVIITILVLIALIIFLIVELPRLIKRYNQRVLRRAGRR
ncbi:MAG TPA: DUF916 domain-containing protein [Candidatus Microsaccharimonas sp.]|nr:DUF916 domain-containing protein [Candidatus Microsaccharimonas sp.]